MKKKILIVDDEPNIIMSLEYTFKKNNFEVFIARDGHVITSYSIHYTKLYEKILFTELLMKQDQFYTGM